MAIIYTYPTKSTPNANDLILISDSQDSNKTKQVKIASLPGGSGSGVSSVTSSNVAITVADASTTPVLTSVAYTGTTNIGHVPTGGSATTFLKGDGTWATPTGTPGGSTTQFQYNQNGNFLGTNLLRFDAEAVQFGIASAGPVDAEQGKIIMYADTEANPPSIELKNSQNAHGVTIKGSTDRATSQDYDIILPVANGTAGQVMMLDSVLNLEYTKLLFNGVDNRVVTSNNTTQFNGEANLTFDGTTLTVADADSDVKITGNGISFPGQADELSDYEEGTWTPAPYVATGSAPTTSVASGTYIKVGDLVNCYFYLNITSTSSANVPMIIGGLPFSAVDTQGQRGSVNISENKGGSSGNFIQQQAISGVVSGNQASLKRLNLTATSPNGGGSVVFAQNDLINASWFASASLNYVLEGTIIYKV